MTKSELDVGIKEISNTLILIVDDNRNNIQVLGTILKKQGFKLGLCSSGAEALDFLERKKADLVLLDVMMPDMDGYATCRAIKEDQSLKDIPVIFLSAKSQTEDKINGFDAGAVDYITKPFHTDEVLARVQTHLKLKKANDVLQHYRQHLEHLVDKQAEELIRMERKAAFNLVSQGVVHNMNNPLATICASAELMMTYLESLEKELSKNNTHHSKLKSTVDLNRAIMKGSTRLADMVENLMIRGRNGHTLQNFSACDLGDVIEKECAHFRKYHLRKGHKLEFEKTALPLPVIIVESEILQVFNNLMHNAQDALYKENGVIKVAVFGKDNMACFRVGDNGNGIEANNLTRIFDPFFTTKETGMSGEESYGSPKGTGLGLYYCAQVIESYGGKISVDSKINQGTTFTIALPLERSNSN